MPNKKSKSVSNLNHANSTMDGQTIFDNHEANSKANATPKDAIDHQTKFEE